MSNEERIAIALERIADVLEKQNAGNSAVTVFIADGAKYKIDGESQGANGVGPAKIIVIKPDTFQSNPKNLVRAIQHNLR